MKLQYSTLQIRHTRGSRLGMRLVLTVVLALAVMLAQSVPGMAMQSTSTSAGWIEICSDGGSVFIQVNEDGQEHEPECLHCDFCLVPAAEVQGLTTAPKIASALTEFTTFSYSTDRVGLPDSPEQYWSATRGPPIASVENIMTPIASLLAKEPAGTPSNTWSIPCV